MIDPRRHIALAPPARALSKAALIAAARSARVAMRDGLEPVRAGPEPLRLVRDADLPRCFSPMS